jgi:hypothetical protein
VFVAAAYSGRINMRHFVIGEYSGCDDSEDLETLEIAVIELATKT